MKASRPEAAKPLVEEGVTWGGESSLRQPQQPGSSGPRPAPPRAQRARKLANRFVSRQKVWRKKKKSFPALAPPTCSSLWSHPPTTVLPPVVRPSPPGSSSCLGGPSQPQTGWQGEGRGAVEGPALWVGFPSRRKRRDICPEKLETGESGVGPAWVGEVAHVPQRGSVGT